MLELRGGEVRLRGCVVVKYGGVVVVVVLKNAVFVVGKVALVVVVVVVVVENASVVVVVKVARVVAAVVVMVVVVKNAGVVVGERPQFFTVDRSDRLLGPRHKHGPPPPVPSIFIPQAHPRLHNYFSAFPSPGEKENRF